MYLGIDIGGTKTLLATFDDSGNIIAKEKIQTNPDYDVFLKDLANIVAEISTNKIIACCVAIPGRINRETGVAYSLGNLGWRDISIREDISKILGSSIEIVLENDAKLAGLSESAILIEKYKRVSYITVSTGIGVALIENGQIVDSLKDLEMGKMPLEYKGKIQDWEEFASGRAIFSQYQQKASDIEDPAIWADIGIRIAYGVAILCSILQPEAIVFGGGVGHLSEKFSSTVETYLKDNLHSNIINPVLLPAHYPEDSVVQGCFILIKQKGLVQ